MRLGVSARIFIGYGLLLVALAGNAAFSVASLDVARRLVGANQVYLELKTQVDRAYDSLNYILNDGSLGRSQRPDPNASQAYVLRAARERLSEALGTIDRHVTRDGGSDRLAIARRQIDELRLRTESVAAGLGTAQASSDAQVRAEFEGQIRVQLVRPLNRLRRSLTDEAERVARELAAEEENASTVAIVLGALGVLVAMGVVWGIWRTLRPLGVLRAHAREIAAGDYARRTGVRSQDEIGDLAREFDAMASAIEEREQRLIRSERLATVGRMAAQITHEIRNPLASIGLNAELLGDEVGGNAEARGLVARISDEVDRLTDITETYLRFARLPRPRLEREDAAAIAGAAVEFSRAELSRGGIAVELRVEPGLPDIAADEAQLRQALLNLLRNAREAMPGGGRLRVEVERSTAGGVRLSVSDDGPGIAAEHRTKIFDPFFSTKDNGTGLGLALVQQIVVEHGGRIEVAGGAGAPARGTTFVITMPGLPTPPAEGSSGAEDARAAAASDDRDGAAGAPGAPGKAG